MKREISKYLNIPSTNITLFWKGRVALYAILKAIGVKKGDEIILPAFTCVVVVNPIIYLEAKPVYVDIDKNTFNIDPKKIEEKITKKTKAILAQNTFGLSSDLDKIFEIAKKYNLFVIEDCAHGFGGSYKGKKNGTISDASFFSTQWNKPFSTGIGGIAVTKDDQIAKNLQKLEEKAANPTPKEEFILKSLILIKKYLLNSNTYWLALKVYRYLSKLNLILGSSQGYELEKPEIPENFFKKMSMTQIKEGLHYFEKKDEKFKIDLIIEHRKKIAKKYSEILSRFGYLPPFEPDYAEHSYLKFPLLVKNREKFLKNAEKEKIELGDWFLSPIHPITENFKLWHYNYGENNIGEFASKHIVNLPTHEKIDENYINKIEKFLQKYKDEIIGCRVPENADTIS